MSRAPRPGHGRWSLALAAHRHPARPVPGGRSDASASRAPSTRSWRRRSATIDNFSAYLDPALTPEDFLDWLAGWVGVLLDENWPIERRRAFVALAAELYRNRGTVKGLQMHVKLFASGEVEIVDNGGAAWSSTPDAAVPGQPQYGLVVRIKPTRKGSVDKARLDALVAAAKPAHIPHSIEIVEG